MSVAKLTQKLGEGAFGKVYKGEYKGEDIAVKVIDLHNASEKEQDISKKEVALLAKLTHPNIVKYKGGVLAIRTSSVQLHIYMEFCEGGDLQAAIDKQKASKRYFPEGRILGWFRDSVRAVQYLHSMNIIHRDIKPLNIMLHNDCIKIGDFGLAKLLHSRQDFQASVIGTVIYACPEILFAQVCTSKGDMWSLGCTLFQLATLDPPFYNFGYVAKFQKDRSRLKSIPKHYSDVLKTLVDVLLRFDSAKRPGATSVLEFFNRQAAGQRKQVVASPAAAGQGGLRVAGGAAGATAAAGPAQRVVRNPYASEPVNMDDMMKEMVKMMMLMEILKRNQR